MRLRCWLPSSRGVGADPVSLTLYAIGGAVAFSAIVAGVAYVKVAAARSDASDARAELAGVKAAIATQRAAYITAARDTEARHATELEKQSKLYLTERTAREKQHASDVAAVRDGFRLRDPGASASSACPSPNPTTVAGSDGPARGELSQEASGFLLSLANEADAVAEQLGACQRYAASVFQPTGATQ